MEISIVIFMIRRAAQLQKRHIENEEHRTATHWICTELPMDHLHKGQRST